MLLNALKWELESLKDPKACEPQDPRVAPLEETVSWVQLHRPDDPCGVGGGPWEKKL